MNNPTADSVFNPQASVIRQSDGSWLIQGRQSPLGNIQQVVRMNVNTPAGKEPWKNVEITGYAKILVASSSADHLTWYARGGRHNSEVPCEGTSLKGSIRVNGNVFWQKEIWHTGGYTGERSVAQATDQSLSDRWIGWKVVMYNIQHDAAVKMESYLDDKDNNHWRKVTEVADVGGWYAKSPDNIFYGAGCDRPKDYIVTNAGPIATFRSDNMIWDFKNLSVREIQPPVAVANSA